MRSDSELQISILRSEKKKLVLCSPILQNQSGRKCFENPIAQDVGIYAYSWRIHSRASSLGHVAKSNLVRAKIFFLDSIDDKV